MTKHTDEYFMFEHSDIDEMRSNMTQADFDKEYGATYDKNNICYHCANYRRCQDIKYIYKEKRVHCIGYIKDENQ
jgi:hypothetical protein